MYASQESRSIIEASPDANASQGAQGRITPSPDGPAQAVYRESLRPAQHMEAKRASHGMGAIADLKSFNTSSDAPFSSARRPEESPGARRTVLPYSPPMEVNRLRELKKSKSSCCDRFDKRSRQNLAQARTHNAS